MDLDTARTLAHALQIGDTARKALGELQRRVLIGEVMVIPPPKNTSGTPY